MCCSSFTFSGGSRSSYKKRYIEVTCEELPTKRVCSTTWQQYLQKFAGTEGESRF